MNLGELTKAERHIQESIWLAPSRSVAWDDLGLVLAKSGDREGAVSCLLTGYETSDDKALTYLQSLEEDKDPDVAEAGRLALTEASSMLRPKTE